MKRILLILFILSGVLAKAQNFNNEWIDYNKTYYKFKIGATGQYRINQSVLSAWGLSNVQAQHFQLWRNGQQVPIYTSVQTGIFGGSDYIEFWGKMNDGKVDKVMYRVPDHQLNDAWNFNTDTAAFFLTVNTTTPNFRLTPATNDVAGNSLPAEPYFMHTAGVNFRAKQNPGFAAVISEYVYSSSYDQGEGWTSADIGRTTTTEFNLATFPASLKVYTGPGAPESRFRINASGNALNPREFIVSFNGNPIDTQRMDYFDYVKLDMPLDVANINSATTTVTLRNSTTVNSDRMVVAMFGIDYPRTFDFTGYNNFSFKLPASATGNYFEISNFSSPGFSPILLDLTNGQRYIGDIGGIPTTLRFKLLPSATERELILVPENHYTFVTTGIQRNFVNYSGAAYQGDYLVISHSALLIGPNGSNPVEAYRAYRSSANGGGYNAKIYMIDELIDQFGFGIKMNPLSVRNFLRWARATYSVQPKFAFLIGKGLTYNQFRAFETSPDISRLGFIPTFGHPASDNLLSTEPGNLIPVTPIGRLSVINGEEILNYLAKVIVYEQTQKSNSPVIQDKAWMKNVIHVVGASDENLESLLEAYMNRYRDVIKDTLYGGNVHLFSKTSAETVTLLNTARLKQLMEQGVGLLTYFGHSATSSLEFNLDDPSNYNNTGKYPVMIVMGCNAGNLFNFNTVRFLTRETLSEKFVLAPNKGSIAFIASTHFGIVHYLDIYNTRSYAAISTTHYGQTLGEQMKETITQVFNLTTQLDYYARFQCEQTSLHGDPAIKLNYFQKPDYAIEEPMVKISPNIISIAEDSFQLNVQYVNLGKAINKDIVVKVERTYPTNNVTEVIYKDTIPGIRFIDSLKLKVPVVAIRDKGLNKITITIDAENAIDEIYETNNTVTKEFFIYEDEARPVYPYNFSIINKQNIKLVASTANPLSNLKPYLLEIDTTELFNSPFKVTRTLTSKGGALEFTPGIIFTDSTVYYWRVAPQPVTGSPVWNSASFIYLANHNLGYNQSHYYQHLRSSYSGLVMKNDRRTVFDSSNNNIFIRNAIFPTASSQAPDFNISVNDSNYINGGCNYDALMITAFHPLTLKAMKNNFSGPTGLYESFRLLCGPRREYTFEYSFADTAGRRKAKNFLENVIPNGYYVVIRGNNSPGNPANMAYSNKWMDDTLLYGSGNSLYHTLRNQGFVNIDSFNSPRTFIFTYKKNDPSAFAPRSIFTIGNFDKITMDVNIKTPDMEGLISSPLMGPAKEWKTLKWRGTTDPDINPTDSVSLKLIGVAHDGQETVLLNDLTTAQQDYDISSFNAASYPYMRLRLFVKDTLNYTPYQLRYWRLTYLPVPEGAIAPNILFEAKDTVDVGEPFSFKVAFKNVSEIPFDSLKVKMVITDRTNTPNIIPIPKRKPLAVNDTIVVSTTVQTPSLSGNNTIYVEVNPDNDQPEQYHFNNFVFKALYVKPDSLNPLLDVTFDNVHILNRDIVSSKPHIVVKLKDEAKWMILDDTSLLIVKVKYPGGTIRQFNFNNDTLRFTPAGQAPNTNNTATIDFFPYFTQDGDYELIVTGKDRSDNAAGNIEYRVVFKVINKPMISNMLNYPNPFTSSTAFVFTITGSEVPQNIRIQILTITGKVVREITKDELGPLHIGRNITEFKWDGTDSYGQKLANGIYLYRVITNHKGKSLEKYRSTETDNEDNTDKFFNNGYGKMYLMR